MIFMPTCKISVENDFLVNIKGVSVKALESSHKL